MLELHVLIKDATRPGLWPTEGQHSCNQQVILLVAQCTSNCPDTCEQVGYRLLDGALTNTTMLQAVVPVNSVIPYTTMARRRL